MASLGAQPVQRHHSFPPGEITAVLSETWYVIMSRCMLKHLQDKEQACFSRGLYILDDLNHYYVCFVLKVFVRLTGNLPVSVFT